MGNKPVRIGLIGTGMVAQVMHLPHLSELPELFEVAALCDLSPGTVQAVGAKYGIRHTFSDYREMLEQADLDAVMVLTLDHARPAVRSRTSLDDVRPHCLRHFTRVACIGARRDLAGDRKVPWPR